MLARILVDRGRPSAGTSAGAARTSACATILLRRCIWLAAAVPAVLQAVVTISTDSLPNGAVRTPYNTALVASGGLSPFVWAVIAGSLPPGITINASSGLLSGSPTTGGSFGFTVQVTDSTNNKATKDFTITVFSGVGISTTSLPGGFIGRAYAQTLAVVGGSVPYTWSIVGGSLPPGITLNGATGLLAGSPTVAGMYTFTAQVVDNASNAAARAFTIVILTGVTISTAPTLPGGVVGVAYVQALVAAGGQPPYLWSLTAGALPSGFSLNASTGALSGTPTISGVFSFTLQAADTAGLAATKQFTLTVVPALTITTTSPLPGGVVGVAYALTLGGDGGTPPYSWALTAGALPPGLQLNVFSGTITGVPSASGGFALTLRLSDASGAFAVRAFAITIDPAPSLPPLPALSINGVPDTSGPLQQPSIDVALAAPYPLDIRGQVALSFETDAVNPLDDPAVQLLTGGRSATFSIPRNTTRAVFSVPEMALQTGSVAGRIIVSVTLQTGDQDITPLPRPTRTIQIIRAVPVVRGMRLVKNATGFEARVTGYSTPREVTQVSFRLTAAPGKNLETTDVVLPLTEASRRYYQDAAATTFGSQFTLVQPFTIQGDSAAIGSVSVTMTNSLGTSLPVSVAY